MQHKSLFAALLCGALCLTACLKNEESPSVTQVRNAKAEELLSIATLNKADAEATLIQAKADEKVKAAEAKLREAEAKVREADAAYRLAEADQVKAETQLKLVEVQLKEIEVEIAKVQLESDKVELERQKAALLAQKAEYEARIAQAEYDKQAAEAAKQLIEKQLEYELEMLKADLLAAQYAVVEAQQAYAQLLKDIEKQAKEAEIAEFEALREEAVRLSSNYHTALRELLEIEAAYQKEQFLAAQVSAGLKDVVDAKNEKIASLKNEIARQNNYIKYLEEYKEAYFDNISTDDVAAYLDQLYVILNAKQSDYMIESDYVEQAKEEFEAAYKEYARNYPVLTVYDSGINNDVDGDGIESGIVYDYTNALFTADEETGVNLAALDVIGTYVDYYKTSIDAYFYVEDIDEEWHKVMMHVARKTAPKDDEFVSSEQFEDVELYRYYKKGLLPMGVKQSIERYPGLPEGVEKDIYDWEDYDYILINKEEFVPMVVNKEGFDKYIALKKEILNDKISQSENALDGMKYISDWYVKTFEAAVKSIEKAKKDEYAKLKKAQDAEDAAQQVLLKAWDAYVKANMLGYEAEAPEQSVLIRLAAALGELQSYLYENSATIAYLKNEIDSRQAEIDTRLEEIQKLEQDDADFKANPGNAYVILHERESYKKDAETAVTAAEKDLETKSKAYDDQKTVTDKAEKDYFTAYQNWWDANRTYEADPTPANLADLNAKDALRSTAWTAWQDAKGVLSTRNDEKNTAETALTNARNDLEAKTNSYNEWLENVINHYTNQIAALNEEIATYQAEIDDLNIELAPYETKRAALETAVANLEDEWKAIDTAHKATAEWAAVEAAQKAIYFYDEVTEKATGTSVDLAKAEEAYYHVLEIINTPRYYNPGYEVYSDPAFPGLENLDWSDLYSLYPEVDPSNSTDGPFYNEIEYIGTLFGMLKIVDAEPWTLLNDFYERTVSLSMADMVEIYHYFTDTDEFSYPYEIAELTKEIADYKKAEQKKIDNIQARLDKVMAGETVYNEGIKNANELSKAYVEKYKAYFDQNVVANDAFLAWYTLSVQIYNFENSWEVAEIASIESEIAAAKEVIANLKKEIDEWDKSIFTDQHALDKMNKDLEVLESEIEVKKVIVETWKKQLDEVMAKIKEYLPEAEEPAAEEEIPAE